MDHYQVYIVNHNYFDFFYIITCLVKSVKEITTIDNRAESLSLQRLRYIYTSLSLNVVSVFQSRYILYTFKSPEYLA